MSHAGALAPILRALAACLPADAVLVSSALAPDPLQPLADAAPGRRHFRFLPEFDPPLTDFGRAERRTDVSRETQVVLGAEDVDLERGVGAFESGLAQAPRWRTGKQRRLDTLFGPEASSHGRLDAVFIGESSARALQVLDGATASWRAWQPMLVLPLDGSAAARELVAWLRQRRCILLDAALRPLDPTGTGAPVTPGWLLAVAPGGLETPALRRVLDAAASDSAEDAAVVQIEGSADAEWPCWGFHPPEGDPGAGWRWIGPRPRAGLMVPATAGRLESVRFQATASASPRNLSEALVAVDGMPASVQLRGSPAEPRLASLEVRMPDTLAWQPTHRLELAVPESRRLGDDKRQLALALTTITLRLRCR